MFSPSFITYALVQIKDDNCFRYFTKAVEKFDGGVPNVYPVDPLESIWVVDSLPRLGISWYFKLEIKECMDYASRYWTKEGICGASRNSKVHDIDDTAMVFRFLRLYGYEVSQDVFWNLENNYPEEEIIEPGIFIVHAYDAKWILALEVDESDMDSQGEKLLEEVSKIDFNGLSGNVHSRGRKVAAAYIVHFVYVTEKIYNAFWSERLGFSETIDHDGTIYNSSMVNLGQVCRPGGLNNLPTSAKPLKVGVTTGSVFQQFVKIDYIPRTNKCSFSGFSIEVFEVTMARL